ncbi:MAG: hypothetical protein GX946_06355 [Oligosphaeraceae bacterium]|nr:hypothetical protein [Oligosphaeraceae bacterium]
MPDLYIYSRGDLLYVKSAIEAGNLIVRDLAGVEQDAPILRRSVLDNGSYLTIVAANALQRWSPNHPQLYELFFNADAALRFGHCEYSNFGNQAVLLNGKALYLRGYIRGIVAHDHPNMTGKSLKEACIKNISQAKKYGFNLVRFHSTVPTPEFVEAADELGMLVHAEIGFSYEYDEAGNKKNLSMDNANWEAVIRRYRNNPSLAVFCIGNEMHNSGHHPEVKHLYDLGKRLAPGKLIMDNSGWGEYDRNSADLFSQHIAYFFPFKKHAGMFKSDQCWRFNGSAYDVKLEESRHITGADVNVRRQCTPLRPVLAHEAVHYIDIPDYEALRAKFDAFMAAQSEEYLRENEIEEPRYMRELPKLIKRKKLEDIFQDYIGASRKFKEICTKTYLERLRLSNICGFEMLQFSDCLKYENKNGIVDFFDDDKGICPVWMRQFNADSVLLAEFPKENFYDDEKISIVVSLSHFGEPENPSGVLELHLHEAGQSRLLYSGEKFILVPGLQKLVELNVSLPACQRPQRYELVATFKGKHVDLKNSWNFWRYPQPRLQRRPQLQLIHSGFASFVASLPAGLTEPGELLLTDQLTDQTLELLAQGRDLLLLYHRDDPWNQYYLPGALERFKPCIWDRGSNLGSILHPAWLQEALASEKYGDLNLYALMEEGYKINLDDFPVRPDEYFSGVDKPVRDRMKGLQHGVKDFIDEDTLRRFSHLFALKVGSGSLTVCTFNKNSWQDPAAASLFVNLLNRLPEKDIHAEISLAELHEYLQAQTARGHRREDVMNRFWEIDNKPVEDTLFWEECEIDLTKLG